MPSCIWACRCICIWNDGNMGFSGNIPVTFDLTWSLPRTEWLAESQLYLGVNSRIACVPLTLSVRIYTRHPVHLHLHPVHLRPVHLHLNPAQVLQVFTPTPQLLHFAMTCHFFVCDWGAKVVRNPVCNCTSWEFRRLRNESKVPDDQTVNRLLAAAQLKSPCAAVLGPTL